MGYSIWDQLPVVGTLKKLKETAGDVKDGNWSEAGKDFASSGDPIIGEAIGYQDAKDEQRHGYDAVQSAAERMKQERMAQKNFAYNLAESKYAPEHAAINALYGDPSTWSLGGGAQLQAPPAAGAPKARGRF